MVGWGVDVRALPRPSASISLFMLTCSALLMTSHVQSGHVASRREGVELYGLRGRVLDLSSAASLQASKSPRTTHCTIQHTVAYCTRHRGSAHKAQRWGGAGRLQKPAHHLLLSCCVRADMAVVLWLQPQYIDMRRLCGQIFCHDCSPSKVQLAASDAPERVCNPCKDIIMTVKDNSDVLSDDQKTGSTIGTYNNTNHTAP